VDGTLTLVFGVEGLQPVEQIKGWHVGDGRKLKDTREGGHLNSTKITCGRASFDCSRACCGFYVPDKGTSYAEVYAFPSRPFHSKSTTHTSASIAERAASRIHSAKQQA